MTETMQAQWQDAQRTARIDGQPRMMWDSAGRMLFFTPRGFAELPSHISAPFASVEGMAQPDEAICDLLAAALYRREGDKVSARARIEWARVSRLDTAAIGIGFAALGGAA